MSILIKPLVTEKFSAMNEHGKYGFVVERRANKVLIRQEVEKKYGHCRIRKYNGTAGKI